MHPRTCGCRGRSPSSSPSTAGGTRPPHPARPSGAGNRRSHHERWPLFWAPAPSRPLSALPGRRRKARRAFSCLPRPSVSLLPAPAAGSTCPTTSGSRPCKDCPSGPSRTSRWSRRPPRRHRRSPSPASRPATPAPSVWQTAFRPALTCSLVSSRGSRPGCSRKQCPDEPAPSLRPHYTGITATTGRSASAAATVLSTSPFQRLDALPLAPASSRAQYQRAPSRVSARKPQTGLAPPARRAPPGQQYGLPPGLSRDGHYRPGSDAVSSSRRFSGGSLAFAFPVPA
jgi:hypothetical protein